MVKLILHQASLNGNAQQQQWKITLGVITASAGNHAQGVANACKKLKVPCLIVMPLTTPEIKIKSVKIKSENDNTLDDEKNNLNETATTEIKNPKTMPKRT